MDRRTTAFSGRVAHRSLAGLIPDVALTDGTAARVCAPLSALRAAPEGALDRQLIYGDAVTIIDQRGPASFVMAAKDGFCGWVLATDLGAPFVPTHRVASPATHAYPSPRVQAEPPVPFYLNAEVRVEAIEGAWAHTPLGYIPARHLAPLDAPEPDRVALAERFIGAPYLWGGNSVAGVDCSGLVQLVHLAAGIPCPADSDQQAQAGIEVPSDAELRRGDLVLWKGHVALYAGENQLLHANGYTMSVAREDYSAAKARIHAHYGGEILTRRRLSAA